MPKTTTTYSLLVSCPGDVQEELKIIKAGVDDFNRHFGNRNNIRLEIKHWSKDSYPESGGRAQELLNNQFIKDCDLAVAVFWTRFGTKTGDYESGTEEEIELLLSERKQVFLYFSNAVINPDMIDHEQYKRVLNFKKKYEELEKGVYYKYSAIKDFETNFLNHLTLHFLNIVTNNDSTTEPNKPQLILSEATKKDNANKEVKIHISNYMDYEFIDELTDKIEKLFSDINNICLPNAINSKSDKTIVIGKDGINKNETSLNMEGLVESFSSFLYEKIERIDYSAKEIIEKYAEDKEIDCNDGFFSIGNLKKNKPILTANLYGNRQNLEIYGTEKEKRKYNLLYSLSSKIRELKAFTEFFSALDDLYYIELMLTNCGNSFDEDIDIEIRINLGCICDFDDLPVPDGFIIEEEIKSFYSENYYGLNGKMFADDYDNGKIIQFSNNSSLLGSMPFGKSNDDYKKEVQLDIKELFNNYDCYQDEEDDILQIKMGYIKHGKSMLLPTKLFFKKKPQYIKYEIKSKYQTAPTIGELELVYQDK